MMLKQFFHSSIAAISLMGAGGSPAKAVEDLRYSTVISEKAPFSESARLARLLEIDFDAYLDENPTYATSGGYEGFAGRWNDYSTAGISRMAERRRSRLAAIESIDRR